MLTNAARAKLAQRRATSSSKRAIKQPTGNGNDPHHDVKSSSSSTAAVTSSSSSSVRSFTLCCVFLFDLYLHSQKNNSLNSNHTHTKASFNKLLFKPVNNSLLFSRITLHINTEFELNHTHSSHKRQSYLRSFFSISTHSDS